jgi:hypothetical protein
VAPDHDGRGVPPNFILHCYGHKTGRRVQSGRTDGNVWRTRVDRKSQLALFWRSTWCYNQHSDTDKEADMVSKKVQTYRSPKVMYGTCHGGGGGTTCCGGQG